LNPPSKPSPSLTYADSGSEYDYVDDGFDDGGERKWRRRSGMKTEANMLGSLDEMRFRHASKVARESWVHNNMLQIWQQGEKDVESVENTGGGMETSK
jgi:hypothetical protein